jgi:hypothetical protein
VILINDDDEFAEITTYERTRVTKLRKNPAAEQRKDLSFGSTTRAHFRVPAKLGFGADEATGTERGGEGRRAARLNSTA